MALASARMPAHAEVGEQALAQRYGVSVIPLMWMERHKLIQTHAREAGPGSHCKFDSMTLTTSREIFGGRVTVPVIATTARFREANPRTYRAFLTAPNEAVEAVNRNPRASALFHPDAAQDRNSTGDEN